MHAALKGAEYLVLAGARRSEILLGPEARRPGNGEHPVEHAGEGHEVVGGVGHPEGGDGGPGEEGRGGDGEAGEEEPL